MYGKKKNSFKNSISANDQSPLFWASLIRTLFNEVNLQKWSLIWEMTKNFRLHVLFLIGHHQSNVTNSKECFPALNSSFYIRNVSELGNFSYSATISFVLEILKLNKFYL